MNLKFWKQGQNKNIFEYRIKWIERGFFFILCIISLRLFYLQIIKQYRYMKIGKTQYEKIIVPAERGEIFDRNGKLLAFNIPNYSVYFDTWMIKYLKEHEPYYLEELKNNLSQILNIDKKEIEEKMAQPYALIKKDIDSEEYKKIKELQIKGIYFEKGYKRVYPYGKHACHVIGYTDREGNGQEGIEYFYNSFLKGEDGLYLVLKDGLGNLIYSIRKVLIEEKRGKDIVLTIDSNIQFSVEEEIKKWYQKFTPKNISVVVMDSKNGEILALANYPNYDPNERPSNNIDFDIRRNKCVTDIFEPGSIFKIVTAAAAIEENLFNPSSLIMCENGKWFVRSHWLHDVHPYNVLTFAEVVEKSSNIGTVKIGMVLGEEKLYQYCRKFRFGEKTGIDLPGEIAGIFRPIEEWSSYSITAIPIGQEVAINSIQGIRAMAVFANDGYLVRPHLIKEIKDRDTIEIISYKNEKEKILSSSTVSIMREILKKVVKPGGTAPDAGIEGYEVYGKTGTAQKAIGGRYIKGKYVSSFVGFLLSNKRDIVISVNIDEPQGAYYGGIVAAPLFRNILLRIINYYQIPPQTDIKMAYKNETERNN